MVILELIHAKNCDWPRPEGVYLLDWVKRRENETREGIAESLKAFCEEVSRPLAGRKTDKRTSGAVQCSAIAVTVRVASLWL